MLMPEPLQQVVGGELGAAEGHDLEGGGEEAAVEAGEALPGEDRPHGVPRVEVRLGRLALGDDAGADHVEGVAEGGGAEAGQGAAEEVHRGGRPVICC